MVSHRRDVGAGQNPRGVAHRIQRYFESSAREPPGHVSEGFVKKTNPVSTDDMRAEHDFASMKGGVRGKYVRRAQAGTNIVLIEPEVTEAFPTEQAVNEALKGVLNPHEPCDVLEGCRTERS